jgi:GNAT superfamily N-acetyltransferase
LLLAEVETYYDAVPRFAARIARIGPFSLFIRSDQGWPFYARPALGETQFTATDVERVRARQRELGIPEAFEWVSETTPGLRAAAEAAGLAVVDHPLMVLQSRISDLHTPGVEVRLATADDDLPLLDAIARVAFRNPGTAAGPAGLVDALDVVVQDSGAPEVRQAPSHTLIALVDGQPVGVGRHQPLGSVTELVGIAVLPAYRRHGIGAALTHRLVEDAQASGVRTIFLSAGDAATSHIYERVGFETVATACIAEPAVTH